VTFYVFCISIKFLYCSADILMFHICPLFSGLVETWQTLPCTNADLWQTFRGMNLSHLPLSSAYETDFEHVTHIHLIVLIVVQMCQTSCAIHIHVIFSAVV
jgi:hypothetical protein